MLSGEITLHVIHIEYEGKIIQEKINYTNIHNIEDRLRYLGQKATIFKYLISLYQFGIIYQLIV